MNSSEIVIVSAKRTAMGAFQGALADATASALGATALRACLAEAPEVSPSDVSRVLMGCVLAAGQGQAPARQAALAAGLDQHVPCVTLNKMCGSGLEAVRIAVDQLKAGNGRFILAGGMESMTNAPYLLPKARSGLRLGHTQVIDHLFLDGLEDAYQKGHLMGWFADKSAAHYHLSREDQDAFALTSLTRAQTAIQAGHFGQEIAPHTVKTARDILTITQDEPPSKAKPEKIPKLKPAFNADGTVTAANASSIADGAAALLLTTRALAETHQLTPLARVVAHAEHAQAPEWFTTAPVKAIEKVLQYSGWSAAEVDLFEINEAFAAVTLIAQQQLDLPLEKINVHGGACALGHPIGASGARILVTLIHALRQRQRRKGVAALCIGGGEANAIAIELL